MAQLMTPEIRAGIFAGESGGDYDALFGFNNRAGKHFADTRVSQMTLGQLDEFDRSTYGPWSEQQLGYRATPTGAYQIVGDTRRAAAAALGLGSDVVYDQATQDRMGEWILQNQGTKAWAGYRGPNDPSKFPAVVASAGGGGASVGAGGAPALSTAEELEKFKAAQAEPYRIKNGNETAALYDFAPGRVAPIQQPGAQDIGILANIITPNRQVRAQAVLDNLKAFS